jgi:anti-sigma regulatory factor (Ser/Thr protein kinase)
MAAMHLKVPVREQSQIGDARRQATKIADEHGLDETCRGRIALVVTELATNLVRYGKEGEILVRADIVNDQKLLEVIAIDRGPGIANIQRCLVDGYSTGGTPGNGMGAIQRLSLTFEIYSAVPAGTVIYCQVGEQEASRSIKRQSAWSAINIPAPHETVCGDTWRVCERDHQLSVLVVDGLGHGPEAAHAAAAGAEAFDRDPFLPLVSMFENLHVRMHGTRGAALAVAQIDTKTRQMKYAGIGNISASLRESGGGTGRGLFSHNGIVGVQFRKAQEFDYPCPPGALLILHSDGLQTRWSLDNYPGLQQRHPGLIAAVLYRDFCRGRDDVTVVVIRLPATESRA